MKYPNGEIVTTGYNNNMLPTDVSGAGNYVPSMTYDSAGRLLTRALGNGLTQNYVYYPWNQQGGRLQSLTTGTLQNLAYQYDPVGNITQITNSVAGETSVYDYDALDRLTSWQLNQDTPETYAYDSAGRLDQKASLDLQYLDSNHVHAVTNANSNTYSYDDNGNQTTRHIGNDTFHLIYDAENRLVEVKKNVTTIAEFTFDGDGKRVMSVIDGETVRFVGGYYERKGSEITKYYMAGAARVAVRKYTIPQSMTVEYMLGDHLGSTSITTDSNGAMVSEMRYKPWGETRYTWTNAPANTSPAYELVKYQYTGQYSYDVEFGLKYYGARFYDSAVGRFVSADTVIPGGTQGYDRYAYVYNNPLRYNDPTGHETQCPDGICENDNNDEDDKLEELKEYVEETLLNNNGQIKKQYTSLQAMLMVMMQAVLLYGNNWNGFLDACSYIFIGVAKHGAGTMLAGHYSSFNGYFDGDSGFHSDFQDDSNQVRHFWAAFADAANPTGDNPNGVASASFGNYFHEIVQDTKSGDDGATVTDYKLSITGIEIAMQAGNQIKSPLALIGVLSYRLGVGGPGYTGPQVDTTQWKTPDS